ncbi:uncharacterized protein SAMN05892883_0364 [Jatrophihabitans sp. GAS493]|uniref:DUF1501 domain-containing protein n=1 Tax=Jatrophihabitans sp. GAS493 TaxID=1907575 RepID=UPI000BB84496|nr:DUF1501 domain-containing protein [Jatrophihabitans sp. GAS493]SOD70705.1 uncharacterized protein SAMN05892883_0364 [Jatrophihabitans sp. GAS493]
MHSADAADINPAHVAADLQCQAATVKEDLRALEALWDKGFTRRKFLAGVGLVSVAALAEQLVTTRVSFAEAATSNGNTVINVFLRGAADGLRILVPASSSLGVDYLRSVRSSLVPADAKLLPLPGSAGWALNSVMAPLLPFWTSKELAFVPAVSAEGVTRSHFQAQQTLDRGGSATSSTGWLDRTLTLLGPGTTFRAVAEGSSVPASLAGPETALGLGALKNFSFPGWDGIATQSETALAGLYRGISGPLGVDVPMAFSALGTAAKLKAAAGAKNGAVYPSGNFGAAMADLATVIRGNVGLQVATVDVGGWDTHTNEAYELDLSLTSAAKTLAAFMTDLGPTLRKKVTVVVMTEFGRRVAMNASGGTDHGHGSVMWLLGGGIVGGQVHGKWTPLSSSVLDQGDVPGLNNAFDVLGEVAQKRLGVGGLSSVFPGHSVSTIGLASTT